MTLSELKVRRLVAQVESEYGDCDAPGLTESEAKFFGLATKARKARVFRNGWPDFLVNDSLLGWVGVEVKSGTEILCQIGSFRGGSLLDGRR